MRRNRGPWGQHQLGDKTCKKLGEDPASSGGGTPCHQFPHEGPTSNFDWCDTQNCVAIFGKNFLFWAQGDRGRAPSPKKKPISRQNTHSNGRLLVTKESPNNSHLFHDVDESVCRHHIRDDDARAVHCDDLKATPNPRLTICVATLCVRISNSKVPCHAYPVGVSVDPDRRVVLVQGRQLVFVE